MKTCFESKTFLSWAEKSGTSIFSLPNLLLVLSSSAMIHFHLFDCWEKFWKYKNNDFIITGISLKRKTEKSCSEQDFNKNFIDSKHVLNEYFKPKKKNSDFGFLPLKTWPVFVKNDHLRSHWSKSSSFNTVLVSVLVFMRHCNAGYHA